MLRILSLLSTLFLFGCSLSNVIEQHSIDYNTTVENATNTMLITNILRAKDLKPLSFADLSQVRGAPALSATAASTWPFNPINSAAISNNVVAGPLTLSSAPTFDIAPENTKKFTQGLLEPVSFDLLRYYLNTNIPQEFTLALFISKVRKLQVVQKGDTEFQRPKRADRTISQYVKLWASDYANHSVRVNTYTTSTQIELKSLVDNTEVDARILGAIMQSLSSGNSPSYKVTTTKEHAFGLEKSSNKSVLCVWNGRAYEPVGIESNSEVKNTSSIDIPEDKNACILRSKTIAATAGDRDKGEPVSDEYLVVQLRSTEQMFGFLGDLTFEGLTFPWERRTYRWFWISPVPLPLNELAFTVNYDGATYYIPKNGYLPPEAAERCRLDMGEKFVDYETSCGNPNYRIWTLEILTILNDLLNLHRDADETPTTKAVQSVP